MPPIGRQRRVQLPVLRNFKLSADALYVDTHLQGQQPHRRLRGSSIAAVGAYFLVNAKLSWEFSLKTPGTNGEIYIAGENLTNESHAFRRTTHARNHAMAGVNQKFLKGARRS
jgi:hypothetical protein